MICGDNTISLKSITHKETYHIKKFSCFFFEIQKDNTRTFKCNRKS